jgi:hypothetical protein
MTNKEIKEDKVDQTEAMEIVEDEATKQQRLVKETITGKEQTKNTCLTINLRIYIRN